MCKREDKVDGNEIYGDVEERYNEAGCAGISSFFFMKIVEYLNRCSSR